MGIPKGKILIDANDIIGKRLGKLKVIGYSEHIYSKTRGGDRMRHYYICECECGCIRIAQRAQILNELIDSCGCGRSKRNGNKNEKNKKPDAVCCECGENQDEVLGMFDLCVGETILTFCDVCNEKIFYKTLHACVSIDRRIKTKHDMAIIRRRSHNDRL